MDRVLRPKPKRRFLGLGIYQIVGGIAGLGVTVWIMFGMQTFSLLLLAICLIPFALYSYSIFSGILLLMKKNSGLKHSFINQCLQLVNFSIAGWAFVYMSGVYFTAGLNLTSGLDFKFNFGFSTWKISLFADENYFIINFNLFALFLLFFIERLKKKVREQEIETLLAQVGSEDYIVSIDDETVI